MRRRRWQPQCERLESVVSLSVGHSPVGTAAVQAARHSLNLSLNGRIDGTWVPAPKISDAGDLQSLSGFGSVRPLGQISASGELLTTGFVLRGRATGLLTLSNAQGTVPVSLTGP